MYTIKPLDSLSNGSSSKIKVTPKAKSKPETTQSNPLVHLSAFAYSLPFPLHRKSVQITDTCSQSISHSCLLSICLPTLFYLESLFDAHIGRSSDLFLSLRLPTRNTLIVTHCNEIEALLIKPLKHTAAGLFGTLTRFPFNHKTTSQRINP